MATLCALKKILSKQHLSVLDTEIKAAFSVSVLYNYRDSFISSQLQSTTESDIRTTSPPRCLRCKRRMPVHCVEEVFWSTEASLHMSHVFKE